MLLEIKKLIVNVGKKEILKSLDLKVKAGEVHVIMGPNGTGKSTLANIITGTGGYKISSGQIKYKEQDIKEMKIDERARKGIFMSFQNPIAIPGVNWSSFLKSSVNITRKAHGKKEMDALEFLKALRKKAKLLEIDEQFLRRSINEGFSGGEKKKFEILQMLMLKPQLIILDEIDSGLDIDALKLVSKNVNQYHNKKSAIIIITHYQRLLDYIIPDHIHIFHDGCIIKSGDKHLAKQVEIDGYDNIIKR
jgi:Fe-S cluster assembly ATP-binding protein